VGVVAKIQLALQVAKETYDRNVSKHYDEVLHEVAGRADKHESLGKLDIGALVAWKRLQANTRWMADLMSMSEAEVRRLTGPALAAVRNDSLSIADAAREDRAALLGLPGCGHGNAVPSALLTACAPTRMAVYDRRAHTGLSVVLEGEVPARYTYADYMELVENLRALMGAGWSNRDVDLALYQPGG
jgi:hypothetical protein